MKKILLTVPVLLALTGCLEKNPLETFDGKAMQSFLRKQNDESLAGCAQHWAQDQKAGDECESKKAVLAENFNKEGYVTTKVKPEHWELPAIWIAYIEAEKERAESRKEYEARRERRKNTWGK